MIVNIFQKILDELGALIGVSLKADSFLRCVILFNQSVKVQFKVVEKSKLLVGTEIDKIMPGKHLELVLSESLKANGAGGNIGFLGYSPKSMSLCLFDRFDVERIDAKELFEFLFPFVERVQKWRDALSRGEVLKEYEEGTAVKGSGFFGIK